MTYFNKVGYRFIRSFKNQGHITSASLTNQTFYMLKHAIIDVMCNISQGPVTCGNLR